MWGLPHARRNQGPGSISRLADMGGLRQCVTLLCCSVDRMPQRITGRRAFSLW